MGKEETIYPILRILAKVDSPTSLSPRTRHTHVLRRPDGGRPPAPHAEDYCCLFGPLDIWKDKGTISIPPLRTEESLWLLSFLMSESSDNNLNNQLVQFTWDNLQFFFPIVKQIRKYILQIRHLKEREREAKNPTKISTCFLVNNHVQLPAAAAEDKAERCAATATSSVYLHRVPASLHASFWPSTTRSSLSRVLRPPDGVEAACRRHRAGMRDQ